MDFKTRKKELLETLKFIKETSESNDWFKDLSDFEKQSLKRGQKDHQNGNTLSSKEFWNKHA
jgi:hypothetical protein